jgi:hypothetical protein
MKLNVTQANILAAEVHKQITDKALTNKVNTELKKTIDKFIKEKKKVDERVQGAEDLLKSFKNERDKFVGDFIESITYGQRFIPYTNKVEDIFKTLVSKRLPSQQDIYNKIVMKSLFASEKEFKDFIDSLIKEYI